MEQFAMIIWKVLSVVQTMQSYSCLLKFDSAGITSILLHFQGPLFN